MTATPTRCPSQEEGLRIHQRLLAGDPTAPSDLAGMYLDALIRWLLEHNRRTVDQHFCLEAAGDSIIALIKNPASYDPQRQTLEVYLRLSARGDLRNILEREWRHTRRQHPLDGVELSPRARKYLGKEDDPGRPLQIEEAIQEARNGIPASVREGLNPQEVLVLELMLRKERKTEVYARAYGIEDLPRSQQRKEIKKVKDRLQKRLERARTPDE